jgi:hypothetical protein
MGAYLGAVCSLPHGGILDAARAGWMHMQADRKRPQKSVTASDGSLSGTARGAFRKTDVSGNVSFL